MKVKFVVALTARMESQRFPGKVMAEIGGRPLLAWLVERFRAVPRAELIIATTGREADTIIAEWAEEHEVPWYRGSAWDVMSRVTQAAEFLCPEWAFILRGLCDCPFFDPLIISRARTVLERQGKEAFLWHLPPAIWPVYGAREFPYARSAWERMDERARGDEREHVDLYFHRHRREFEICYHEAPDPRFFRDYRLEVDTVTDLKMMREIAAGPGMGAPLVQVISFLDAHPEVAEINQSVREKTGPKRSYSPREEWEWWDLMRGAEVIAWDDLITLFGEEQKAKPVRCGSGKCHIGWVMRAEGTPRLYRTDGSVITGRAYLSCSCGAGKEWYPGLSDRAEKRGISVKKRQLGFS